MFTFSSSTSIQFSVFVPCSKLLDSGYPSVVSAQYIMHSEIIILILVISQNTKYLSLWQYLTKITTLMRRPLENLPTQHSRRAQGLIFTTSGGSTPTFRHSTRATLTVFICTTAEKMYDWLPFITVPQPHRILKAQ